MYFTLLITAVLTAIALVAAGLFSGQTDCTPFVQPNKGEAYECGLPTPRRFHMPFKVGYYLFAILFLMFDIETVFLFLGYYRG